MQKRPEVHPQLNARNYTGIPALAVTSGRHIKSIPRNILCFCFFDYHGRRPITAGHCAADSKASPGEANLPTRLFMESYAKGLAKLNFGRLMEEIWLNSGSLRDR